MQKMRLSNIIINKAKTMNRQKQKQKTQTPNKVAVSTT